MNERIRELHNLACRIDMEQHPDAIPDGERIQQKFAELIVRECAKLIDAEESQSSYGDMLKQHFGMEEE